MGSIAMNPIDPFRPVVLRHPHAHLAASIIPLGLNVTRLVFRDPSANGKEHDVIVGPENEQDHWTKGRTFLGPMIGRYANRLPAGKLSFDGGQLELDEFSAPGVCLHGGPAIGSSLPEAEDGKLYPQHGPFDRLVWSRLSSSRSQFFGIEAPSTPSGSSAIFGVISAGASENQKGFPGTVRVEVRLAIEPAGRSARPAAPRSDQQEAVELPALGQSAGFLNMEYRAQLVDEDCQATPLNLTHHWGFNLSASEPGSHEKEHGRVDQHTLRMFLPPTVENGQLASDTTAYKISTPELDQKAVPTGKLIESQYGDAHDWLHPGKLGYGRTLMHEAGLPQCYDNYYAWGAPDQSANAGLPSPTLLGRPAVFSTPRVVLRAPSTGLSLAFRSNQPGVQVYAATFQPDAPAAADSCGGAQKRLHAATPDEARNGIAKRGYVALEFGYPHATFLHQTFQDVANGDTILRKGQQYRHWVEVELYKG